MSNSEPITFFDLPAKDGKCWSLNPWKTRLLFNYKGLDYKTEWVEYPDLEKRFSPHLSPNKDSQSSPFPYSIPTVMFPDGEYVRDSIAIRDEIEKRYPNTPNVHLDSPILPKVQEILRDQIQKALGPVYVTKVPEVLLNPPSAEYFIKDRQQRLGTTMDELKKKAAGDACWKAAQPGMEKMTALLNENKAGPFFMGDTISYSDFVYASFLIFMQRQGMDVWDSLLDHCGDRKATAGLLLALDKYTLRSDR